MADLNNTTSLEHLWRSIAVFASSAESIAEKVHGADDEAIDIAWQATGDLLEVAAARAPDSPADAAVILLVRANALSERTALQLPPPGLAHIAAWRDAAAAAHRALIRAKLVPEGPTEEATRPLICGWTTQ